MLYGCSRTQRIRPFIASLRSTSFSSHSLPSLASLKGQLVGRVVLQHIQNEPFFDRLLHRVDVERLRQIVFALRAWTDRRAARTFSSVLALGVAVNAT